jgi:predicted transporter
MLCAHAKITKQKNVAKWSLLTIAVPSDYCVLCLSALRSCIVMFVNASCSLKREKLRCCGAVFRAGLYLGRTNVFRSVFPDSMRRLGCCLTADLIDDDDDYSLLFVWCCARYNTAAFLLLSIAVRVLSAVY